MNRYKILFQKFPKSFCFGYHVEQDIKTTKSCLMANYLQVLFAPHHVHIRFLFNNVFVVY